MIYLKNNTEKQTIFIPRNELQKEAFITTIRTYEDGLKEGYGNGIEDQKDQLLNLYVTENGIYEREDGYGKVTVVVNEGGTDCKEAIETAYEDGYKEGYEDGAASIQIDLENKSIDIVSNGEYTVTPTDGFDALESVKISVDVPNEGNCNLEDKIIAPQTNEVDGSGYIYIRPNEGYDGMMEVALQTDQLKNGWYNEGYEQGKSEGGEIDSLGFSIKTFSAYCKGGYLVDGFNKNEVRNVFNESTVDTLEIREKVSSNDEKYNIFTKAESSEGYNTYIEGGFAIKKSNITQMDFCNVQEIKANVFSGCELLEEITFKSYQAALPNFTINDIAFGNCPNLKKIVLDFFITREYPPFFYDSAFEGCPTDGTIYVTENTHIDALQFPYPLSEWTVKIID